MLSQARRLGPFAVVQSSDGCRRSRPEASRSLQSPRRQDMPQSIRSGDRRL